MHSEIANETLKTGEVLHIEQVIPPDTLREGQIQPFLAHKPPNYYNHIEAAFAGQCDDLETRFTVGLLDGEVVGNIMTVECAGVGVFGHVNTREDQRRKGICQSIMRHQMADFRERGGHTLLLGTGYQSAAYRIYESFGFRDWTPGSPGLMRYDNPATPDFEAAFFAPAACRPVPAKWKHWPLVSLLASVPTDAALRCLTFGLRRVGLLEGPFCRFLYEYGGNANARAAVLESETGAAMAMALCVPDRRWDGDVHLLDLFSHPNAAPADLTTLLESLPLPAARLQSYADPRDAAKIAALESLGFQREAILPAQFRDGGTWQEAWLYAQTV